ncbi:MAG: hypothetical protein SOR93_02520 [Clostridiales Family XIII bacterium]|nr:hypothetical protein [Clostridia bacterium]MDY3010124.1 hypothetical protein [Clostridiales Family XIII bacterium]
MTIPYRPLNEKNKNKYIDKHYKKFKKKYGSYIFDRPLPEINYSKLFYSIMIFENYNRPACIRVLEYIVFCIRCVCNKRKHMSLGIMQIKTEHLIFSMESIKSADLKLQSDLKKVLPSIAIHNSENIVKAVALEYNQSILYSNQIWDIYLRLSNNEHKL